MKSKRSSTTSSSKAATNGREADLGTNALAWRKPA